MTRLLTSALAASATIMMIAATLAPSPALAQDRAACDTPEARAFDFWLGTWDIRQRILRADGSYLELPATTSVTRALDGCALVERWTGTVQFFWEGMDTAEPMEGLSVRAYDPVEQVWRIHWMDSRSPRFGDPYVGKFANGRGEFFREWSTPQGQRRGRITFAGITDSTVNWSLAVSADSGRSWQTVWAMAMRRRAGGLNDGRVPEARRR